MKNNTEVNNINSSVPQDTVTDKGDAGLPVSEEKATESLQEAIPLQTITEETKDNGGDLPEKKMSLWQKMKADPIYREKVLLSLSICWSFIILGWVVGQFGPSFLDLQIITSTQLDKASGFLTSGAIGYLVGSLISGILFDKFNKTLLLCSFTFCGVLIFAVIPWCFWYELMMTMQFFRGFYGGGLDAGGNALLMSTWGQDGRSFMQALHFAFAFGGIISPLVTAPFLLEEKEFVKENNSSLLTRQLNTSLSSSMYNASNSLNTSLETSTVSTNSSIAHRAEDSKLYIAFSITAALHLAGALPFLVIYLRARRRKRKNSLKTQEEETKRLTRELSLGFKVVVLASICLYMFMYCSVEDSFNSFLTTFCVKHLEWTKAEGSFATSLFWAAFGIGRFLGIWIIKLASPAKLLCGFSIALSLIFAALLAFSQTMIHGGIWACAVGIGAAMSIIFPTVFTWTEEKLLPVSGKVASLIMISSSSGSMVNPIVLGFLMDTKSPIWFSYLLFGESVLLVLLYLNLLLIARLCDRKYGTSYKDVTIEIKAEEDMVEKDSLIEGVNNS